MVSVQKELLVTACYTFKHCLYSLEWIIGLELWTELLNCICNVINEGGDLIFGYHWQLLPHSYGS